MEKRFPLSPCRAAAESALRLLFMLLMFNFYDSRDGASDSIKRREKNYAFCAWENSAIKIFSNEKFYEYDDGFGIRIKQRFSAIIRRHLWQTSSHCESYRLRTIFFFLRNVNTGAEENSLQADNFDVTNTFAICVEW